MSLLTYVTDVDADVDVLLPRATLSDLASVITVVFGDFSLLFLHLFFDCALGCHRVLIISNSFWRAVGP